MQNRAAQHNHGYWLLADISYISKPYKAGLGYYFNRSVRPVEQQFPQNPIIGH